jgi:hypothetical protein
MWDIGGVSFVVWYPSVAVLVFLGLCIYHRFMADWPVDEQDIGCWLVLSVLWIFCAITLLLAGMLKILTMTVAYFVNTPRKERT